MSVLAITMATALKDVQQGGGDVFCHGVLAITVVAVLKGVRLEGAVE